MNRHFLAFKLAVLTLLTATTLACTAGPPTITTYEKEGVSFQHYANWKVTEDAELAEGSGVRFINLEGPDEAIIMLTLMPSPVAQTLEDYATTMAREFTAAITETAIGPIRPATASPTGSRAVSARIGGADQAGISHTYTVSVLGVKVPHVANFYQLVGPKTTAFIVTQVATEDAQRTAPSMSIALDSLRIGTSR
jgi:hypothetical protein